MLDVTRTQAIPAYPPQPAADQASTPYPPAEYYAYPQGAGTPAPGQGAPGYGAPGHVPPGQGWQGQQPPQRRSGWATGCLVAAVVGALLLVAAVVGGIFFVNRAVDQVNETLPSLFPTGSRATFPRTCPAASRPRASASGSSSPSATVSTCPGPPSARDGPSRARAPASRS